MGAAARSQSSWISGLRIRPITVPQMGIYRTIRPITVDLDNGRAAPTTDLRIKSKLCSQYVNGCQDSREEKAILKGGLRC
jgi:hypothetical protein